MMYRMNEEKKQEVVAGLKISGDKLTRRFSFPLRFARTELFQLQLCAGDPELAFSVSLFSAWKQGINVYYKVKTNLYIG